MENKKSWKLTKLEKEKVVSMWLKGKSGNFLSRKFGVDSESVRMILKNRIPKKTYEKVSRKHMKRFLAMKKPITIIKRPKISQDFAWWLGALKGDGSINYRYKYVRLEVTDKDFRDKWAEVGKKVFGMNPRLGQNKNKGSFIANFNSKLLVEYLENFGNFGVYKWDVPKPVLESDFLIKSAFLRGLFDAEGSVKGTPKPREITFVSVNRKATISVKKLLNEMGIENSMKSEIRKNGKVYQKIRIGGFDNLRRFNFSVSFTISRKSEILRNYLTRMYHREGLI